MQYYIILKLIFSWGFLAFLGAILTVVGIGKLFPNTLTSELAIYVGLHFFILYSLLLEQVFEKVQFLIIPTWSLAMALLFWTTYAYWGWVYLPYPLFLFYGIYWVAHKKNVKVSVLEIWKLSASLKNRRYSELLKKGKCR